MIANLSFVTALRYGPISILTPLLGFSAIVTVSLDYLILSEALSRNQLLGLVSVIVGSALLIRAGWIEKAPTKSLVLGLIAASGWGVQTFLDPIGISEIGLHRWGAILAFSIFVPLIFFARGFSFNLKLLIPGVFLFLASFAQLKSLEFVSSGVLESIKRGTILPLAMIIGAVIFKEAVSLRKAIAVSVMLVGGVTVSLA
jgi:drug/metabolite transporter (DMT)-like permease